MSFDKLHKWWNRQSAIVVVYVVVMLLPNVLARYYGALFVHDRDRLATDAGSCLSAARRGAEAARAADALFVSADGSRRVPHRAAVSVRRVDHRGGTCFTNLFYDETPPEAGELLGNIWPSIVFVIVLYVPLIVLAALAAAYKTGFRSRSAVGRRSELLPH